MRKTLVILFIAILCNTSAQETPVADKKITPQMELDAMRYCFDKYETNKTISQTLNSVGYVFVFTGGVTYPKNSTTGLPQTLFVIGGVNLLIGRIFDFAADNWIKKAGKKPKFYYNGAGFTYEF